MDLEGFCWQPATTTAFLPPQDLSRHSRHPAAAARLAQRFSQACRAAHMRICACGLHPLCRGGMSITPIWKSEKTPSCAQIFEISSRDVFRAAFNLPSNLLQTDAVAESLACRSRQSVLRGYDQPASCHSSVATRPCP